MAIFLVLARGELPVFRKVGDQLEVLPHCSYPAPATYTSLPTVTRNDLEVSGQHFIIEAYRLANTGVERENRYSIQSKITGTWLAGDLTLTKSDLRDCPDATHVARRIDVGAYVIEVLSDIRGGASVGTSKIGARGGAGHSTQSLRGVGIIENCVRQAGAPPPDCDAPVSVDIVPIPEPEALVYHVDTSRIIGQRSSDPAPTVTELEQFRRDLHEALVERGRTRGIEVRELTAADPTQTLCDTKVDPKQDRYVVECRYDGYSIVQVNEARKALHSTIPELARRLIPDRDAPSSSAPQLARLVILVDNSKSMVVNDHDTYIEGPHASKRYQTVKALLEGLMLHDVFPQVSVVAFADTACAVPAKVAGSDTWALGPDSSDDVLEWLETAIVTPPCTGSTDLHKALEVAGNLLEHTDERSRGADAVVLITDGFHQSLTASGLPRDEAIALHQVGVSLHVIRVQLNDYDALRTRLGNKSLKRSTLSRWEHFASEPYDDDWEQEIEGINMQNDDGNKLLADLDSVDIGGLVLGANDLLDNPVLNVHHILLPQLGASAPIEGLQCDRPTRFTHDDGTQTWDMACALYVPLGRELTIQATLPTCMEDILRGRVHTRDTPPIDLRPAVVRGGRVVFERTMIGTPTPGRIDMDKANLVIRSKVEEGVPCP